MKKKKKTFFTIIRQNPDLINEMRSNWMQNMYFKLHWLLQSKLDVTCYTFGLSFKKWKSVYKYSKQH